MSSKVNKSIKITAIVAASVIIAIAVIRTAVRNAPREREITLGIFVGSNWTPGFRYGYIYIDDLIERYEKENPDVKVAYRSGTLKSDYSEWVSRQIIKDSAPDVFVVLNEDFETFASIGALADLDKFIAGDTEFNQDRYYESVFALGKMDGTQYAIPTEVVPKVMLVNKDLLKENGFSLGSKPLDWDRFYEICSKVTRDTDGDGIVDRFGAVNYTWDIAAFSNGQSLFNGRTPVLYSQELYNAVIYYQKMTNLNHGQIPLDDVFINGKAAFMITDFAAVLSDNSYPYNMMKGYDFDWTCILPPAGPDNISGICSPVDTVMYGISSKSKNPELAWDFMKFIVYDEESQIQQLLYSNTMSAQKSVNLSAEFEEAFRGRFGNLLYSVDLEEISSMIEKSVVTPSLRYYQEAYSQIDNTIRTTVYEKNFGRSTLMDLQDTIKAHYGE